MIKNFKEKCIASEKGFCNIGIAHKCLYGKSEPFCIITDFTDYLLIKVLLKSE